MLAIFMVVFITGCNKKDKTPPKPVDKLAMQAQAAAEEAAAATIVPQEIEMIKFRRKVMGRAGLQLYVVFFNDMGQPIEYFVTDGKCTSSNKRLTDTQDIIKGDKGSYYGWFVVPSASEDGTYGSSDEYIFCKTVDGKYKQWNGDYYASDRPIELQIKPLVIEIGKKIQSQG